MRKDVKTLVFVGIVALVAFLAYKKFHRSYEPIVFQGQTYLHVELLQENEFAETHFFSVGGKPMAGAQYSIQIIKLSPKVTEAMRDSVDSRIRSGLRLEAVDDANFRLFGVMQNLAVHIFLMEYAYVIYTEPMLQGGEPEYRARAEATFKAMESIPADSL